MKDLEILLENKAGNLALMGEILGAHNISREGGGVFENGDYSIAHFLVVDADRANAELEKAGIKVVKNQRCDYSKIKAGCPWSIRYFLQGTGKCRCQHFNVILQPFKPIDCSAG